MAKVTKTQKKGRVTKTQKKGKVLKVDSADKVPALEKMLGNGSITFVLIYADWCGACTRFKKNIWNPMCEKSAIHSRAAIRDDMVKNTSLASAEFDYLPSLIVVDEKGNMQSFKTPEGKNTNAMPTPQNLTDMKRIVNVPAGNLATAANATNATNATTAANLSQNNISESPVVESLNTRPELTTQALPPVEVVSATPVTPTTSNISNGKSYIPTPMVAPQKGGLRKTRRNRRGIAGIPNKMLKGIAGLFRPTGY
jgi:hypothetical protein